ncbi:MAG: PA14 domain-containing protein [Bdellovibrionota bacterium]
MTSIEQGNLKAAGKHSLTAVRLLQDCDSAPADVAPSLVRGWLSLQAASEDRPTREEDLVTLPAFLEQLHRDGLNLKPFSPEQWSNEMQQLTALAQHLGSGPESGLDHARLWQHSALLRRALRAVEARKSWRFRMVTPARLLLVALCVIAVSAYFGWQARVTGRWRAEFYTNTDLLQTPDRVVRLPGAVWNWTPSGPFPDFTAENYSARFTSTLVLDAPQTLTFQLTSDDGSKLLIDGALAIDAWSANAHQSQTATVTLQPGRHSIEIDYFQGTGEATLKLELISPDGQAHPIPEKLLEYPNGGSQ